MTATGSEPKQDVAAPATLVPCHDARDLVGKDGTADIVLDGQTYRLRITRTGKLILTK